MLGIGSVELMLVGGLVIMGAVAFFATREAKK